MIGNSQTAAVASDRTTNRNGSFATLSSPHYGAMLSVAVFGRNRNGDLTRQIFFQPNPVNCKIKIKALD